MKVWIKISFMRDNFVLRYQGSADFKPKQLSPGTEILQLKSRDVFFFTKAYIIASCLWCDVIICAKPHFKTRRIETVLWMDNKNMGMSGSSIREWFCFKVSYKIKPRCNVKYLLFSPLLPSNYFQAFSLTWVCPSFTLWCQIDTIVCPFFP